MFLYCLFLMDLYKNVWWFSNKNFSPNYQLESIFNYYRAVRSKSPPSPRKYPALVKGRFPNVDFWIFQNPSTTDDFWSDALNTPPWLAAKKINRGVFRTNCTVHELFFYFANINTFFHLLMGFFNYFLTSGVK